MKRLVESEDRTQITLLPECLDDYVGEDNPIRVVEVFVDELDLGALGFEGVDPASTGRPAHHPLVLLKIYIYIYIYIYGYLNRIQSSRRLEVRSSAQRRAHVAGPAADTRLQDHRDFRLGQRPRDTQRVLCHKLDLFSQSIVAIDGSKFKAVNNRDRNFTDTKMSR
jgi:transposase